MPEETEKPAEEPKSQPPPLPSQPPPLPQEDASEEAQLKTAEKTPKKGGWFQKIPPGVLLSPGGIILIFLAIAIDVLDFLMPIPIINQIIKLPLEIFFVILYITITKAPFKSLLAPIIIEQIPIINILPMWIIKMLF